MANNLTRKAKDASRKYPDRFVIVARPSKHYPYDVNVRDSKRAAKDTAKVYTDLHIAVCIARNGQIVEVRQ